MKAYTLQYELNAQDYTVADFGEYIAIGGPLCHNLISVKKDGWVMDYSLGHGEKPKDEKLLAIWNKLATMLYSGRLQELINENEPTEGCTPVYTFKNGRVVEKFAKSVGWPNTTTDGELMYENTFFLTREEAKAEAVKEYEAGIRLFERRIKELKSELLEAENLLLNEKAKLVMIQQDRA